MICSICSSHCKPSIIKQGVQYYICKQCNTLYCEIPENVIVTENDNSEGRKKTTLYDFRIKIAQKNVTSKINTCDITFLDFGCGHGDFIQYLNKKGFNALGIDINTDLQLKDISDNSVDIITMIEVIEHLSNPLPIFIEFKRILKPSGIIFCESSFLDFIGNPIECDYVNPAIGHRFIQSKTSVGIIAHKIHMSPTWINRNIFIMDKTS